MYLYYIIINQIICHFEDTPLSKANHPELIQHRFETPEPIWN